MGLHNFLLRVYREEIVLDEETTQKCTDVVTRFIIPVFIANMKEVDPLFDQLNKEIYYGGSYYDGLRVGAATEFDLNIVINHPSMRIDQTEPGFASLQLNQSFDKFAPFLGPGDRIIPGKLRNWFKSVCSKAERQCSPSLRSCNIRSIRLMESGPALNLEIQTLYDFVINIDLVPVLQNGETGGQDAMFLVPKPHSGNRKLWRCSYPFKERDLLKDGGCAKMVIKLLKKLRDEQQWDSLASYYLKTVVMLMKGEYEVWSENRLGEYFIKALKRLSSYLSEGKIPFYHNHGCNLLKNVGRGTLSNINDRLEKIIRDFENAAEYNETSAIRKYF